jgi:hypothetical protein
MCERDGLQNERRIRGDERREGALRTENGADGRHGAVDGERGVVSGGRLLRMRRGVRQAVRQAASASTCAAAAAPHQEEHGQRGRRLDARPLGRRGRGRGSGRGARLGRADVRAVRRGAGQRRRRRGRGAQHGLCRWEARAARQRRARETTKGFAGARARAAAVSARALHAHPSPRPRKVRRNRSWRARPRQARGRALWAPLVVSCAARAKTCEPSTPDDQQLCARASRAHRLGALGQLVGGQLVIARQLRGAALLGAHRSIRHCDLRRRLRVHLHRRALARPPRRLETPPAALRRGRRRRRARVCGRPALRASESLDSHRCASSRAGSVPLRISVGAAGRGVRVLRQRGGARERRRLGRGRRRRDMHDRGLLLRLRHGELSLALPARAAAAAGQQAVLRVERLGAVHHEREEHHKRGAR